MPRIGRNGAAIMAGGSSRRMGQNKAMLEIGGRSMLARCVDALQPVASPIIVVVAELPACFNSGDYRAVGDLYPGAGPVGGIVTALDALGDGFHLVVACDMPFVQTTLLELLIEAANDGWDAVVPWIEGRPEPLCALYRHTCAVPFQEFLARGQRAAHRALETVRTLPIPESDLRRADPEMLSFINLNTPEDAGRWQRRLPLQHIQPERQE